MTPIIRQATLEDAPALAGLYRAQMEEQVAGSEPGPRLSDSATTWECQAACLARLIVDPDALVMVAVGPAGDLVGYELAALAWAPDPFEVTRALRSISTYIVPEHRKGRLADRLVKDALAWGRAAGCEWAECRTNVGSTAQTLLYRGGFDVVGVEMRMKL